jgi:hypothetical protein
MLSASLFLVAIAVLGAFDIAYFHTFKGRLTQRPECRLEAKVHAVRSVVYAVQFFAIASVRVSGWWCLAMLALFLVDAGIAVFDVLIEPSSREAQGGLQRGEYLMHMVLSVLVGGLLRSVYVEVMSRVAGPSGFEFATSLPSWLESVMHVLAIGSLGAAVFEALLIWEAGRGRATPVKVNITLRASLESVWALTQNHHLHPTWDYRFSRITMLGEVIQTGTCMRYERAVGPVTIHGFGKYLLHRLHQQSTFEFWSDDWRSLIRRGVGVWLYARAADGGTEFSTAYTYEVRWGACGRLIDRLLLRPFMQWDTTQSFLRLQRKYFATANHTGAAALPMGTSLLR